MSSLALALAFGSALTCGLAAYGREFISFIQRRLR